MQVEDRRQVKSDALGFSEARVDRRSEGKANTSLRKGAAVAAGTTALPVTSDLSG